MSSSVLDEIQVEEPVIETTKQEEESGDEEEIPTMGSPKWSEYVLRQLEDDELIDGNPTTDGLRRITNIIFGPIIQSCSRVVQPPNKDNDYHAVVEHTIIIKIDDFDTRSFTDCADVYHGNTKPEFNIYATATAATRAEGRALRKALQLKRVIAAEESEDMPVGLPNKINNIQINFIDMMCKRNDINVMKLLNISKKAQYNSIEDVPHATAVQINKYLSAVQKGEKKIPESVVGYQDNWRGEK